MSRARRPESPRLVTQLAAFGGVLLATAALTLGQAEEEAVQAIEQRSKLLARLHDVQQSCRAGRLPAPIELQRLEALFPGQKLEAVAVDGACYLTFVSDHGPVERELLAARPR